jgi:hypothetical protein
MTSLFKLIHQSHDQHNNINDHPAKYVEAMKTSYGKKEVGKIGRASGTISI